MTEKDDYADRWRADYDKLSCSEHIKKLSTLQKDHVPKPKTTFNFREDTSFGFFDYIFKEKDSVRVLEFGGGLGHLADKMISKYGDKIIEWTNYEMQTFAITDNSCDYEQYTSYISNKFIWEQPLKGPYDVFVSTHSIEHIKAYQLNLLMNKIRNLVDYVYLESPLCDDSKNLTPETNVNRFFKNCSALHILEIGWNQVLKMLPEYVLVEDFCIPYIVNAEPSYPSLTDNSIPVPDVDVSYKTFFLEDVLIKIGFRNNYGLRLPGRGCINYNSPRNNGGVRCLVKKPFNESMKINSDMMNQKKLLVDSITKENNPFVFHID